MPWFHLFNHGILHASQYAMEPRAGPLMGFSDFRHVTYYIPDNISCY